MATVLWSASPTVSDLGADWATYTASAFASVASDAAGTIASAPDGAPALRAQFGIGDSYGFNNICEPLVLMASAARKAVTLRYEVYLDENVDYLAVADLGGSQTFGFLTFPGLVGGEIWPGVNDHAYPTGGEPQEGNNWSGRIRVDGAGRIGPYMYVENRPGAFGWHRTSSHSLRINDLRGRISEWEQTCIMNTPGIANGRVVLRIDGETIVDVSDLEYGAAQFASIGANGIRLQAHVQSNESPDGGAAAAFDYWVRNFSIESESVVPNSLRIARQNLIDTAVVTASTSVASLPASNLQTEDIREVWRAGGASASILADLGSTVELGITALMGTNLALLDTQQVRVSSVDATGAAGDVYDSGVVAAAADPVYGMLVHPIEPAVSGRYLRIDLAASETIEAGRWMAGPVFSPSRHFSLGWEPLWDDPSRHIESLGQATLIDAKLSRRGFDFSLRGLTETEADEIAEINRVNGRKIDVLVCRDITATNLGKVSIWGIMARPIAYPQTNKTGAGDAFYEASFEVWERL